MLSRDLPHPSTVRLLAAAGLDHRGGLVVLAHEFDDADVAPLHDQLDDLARPLFGLAGRPLGEQADALSALLNEHLGACLGFDGPDGLPLSLGPPPASAGHDGLLPSRALPAGAAPPVLIAPLGQPIAARAGLQAQVCTD